MAWIEVHQSLPNHRKTLAAADLLDIHPVHFMGHIISFWLWALDNAPDGRLDGISPRMIARSAEWHGDPIVFFDALLKAGFIDQVGDSYVIHDWHDYAGKLIERKAADRERKLRKRSAGIPSEFQRKDDGNPHVPNLTLPNLTQDKELLTRASPDDDAREGTSAKHAVIAGHDPGGSVEAEMVTATPGEQQVAQEHQKADKPRPPFTSKRQEQMFDRFWELYPRKKSKGQAEKVWARLRPNDKLFASILAVLERAKASYEWQKDGGRYIPYPATWLNAKGWEDEYTPSRDMGRRGRSLPDYIIKQLEAEREMERERED